MITPTAHPLDALAASLTRHTESAMATAALSDELAHDPRSLSLAARQTLSAADASHVLLVVEQFEELFTLCRNERSREPSSIIC